LASGAPLRQKPIGFAPSGPMRLQARQQKSAISSHHQRRLPGHARAAPPLRWPHAQGGFLLARSDFNFPTVQLHLQQRDRWCIPIGGQQESRATVQQATTRPTAMGHRSHDQPAQRARTSSRLPQNKLDFFVAQLAAFAAVPELRALPSDSLVLPPLFRCELLLLLRAARPSRSRRAQPHIGARATQQFDALQRRAEQSTVAEAAVTGHQQRLVRDARLVQALAQVDQ